MKNKITMLIALVVSLLAGISAQAQISTPDLTGLGTNVNTVVGASVTGMNFALGASVVIGGALLGLAILGAIHSRARLRTPK